MLAPLNKTNFYYQLSRFSTAELENLIEKFPYFQEAHLLLAKKYQQEKHPRFDQQLQLAVLYTQDRELFYSVFNEKTNQAVRTPVTQVPLTTDTMVEITTEQTLQPELENLAEQELPQEQNHELEPQQQTPTSTDAVIRSLIVLTPEEKPEPETFSTNTAHTFNEWLKAYEMPSAEKQMHTKAEMQEPVADNQQIQDEELEKLYLANIPVNLQELVEEETNYSKGLDKFIEEQIQKHKPLAASKPFNENEIDPQLVTETMAKVYEMQKKYAKAIECYQMLALKFPKKNDFFAARINYLKNIT